MSDDLSNVLLGAYIIGFLVAWPLIGLAFKEEAHGDDVYNYVGPAILTTLVSMAWPVIIAGLALLGVLFCPAWLLKKMDGK